MFRKLYLLFLIRSISKSLKTYSNTANGKITLDLFYQELQDTELRDDPEDEDE